MPSISSCPECHRDLTIPDVTDRQQSLACPLCNSRFLAERVLAESVSFPPAAIVIVADDFPAHSPDTGESLSDEAIQTEAETREVETASSEQFAAAASAAAIEPAAATEPAPSHAWPIAALHDTGAGEDVGSAIEEAAAAAAESETEPSAESADYESFGQQAATMRVAPRVKRQTSALGAVGQLIGMALGGVLGLAIGYWVLVWIGGPEKDFLHLRGKVPRWLMPPRRHSDGSGPQPFASAGPSRTANDERSLADLLDDTSNQDTAPATNQGATDEADEEAAGHDAQPWSPNHAEIAEERQSGPSALPASYLGPRAFKPRTVDDLVASIDAAQRLLRCPHCQTYGGVRLASFAAPIEANVSPRDEIPSAEHCDYCRGKPLAHLTADAFERLCDLAEAVTFVQFEPDDPRRNDCREAAEQIIMAIGAHRERCEVAGRLAGERLEDSQRESNGILLTATVQRAEVEGDFFALRLMLLGSGKAVSVLSRQPPEPPLERRDRVVVLGSIIDSPRDNLAGYFRDLTQVVWGGLPLKLAPAAR